MKRPIVVVLLTVVFLILSGCKVATSPADVVPGPNPNPNPSPETSTIRDGYFIDGPLSGLAYETSSGKTGLTNADGLYRYVEGDTIEFLLGGQLLGAPVSAAATVSPLTLFGAADLDDGAAGTKASNLIRLLMSLDDGSNPYGLTIPAAVDAALKDSVVVLSELLASTDFANEAQLLVSSVVPDAVVPNADEAQSHWELSEQLKAELNRATDDTMVLAVRIPDGYVGSRLQLSYHAETPPPANGSYRSGEYHTVTEEDHGIVVFRGKLHSSRWQVTLSLSRSESKVQAGDLLSFFHGNGFSQSLPSTYDLDLTAGRRVLQADLSSGEAVVVQTVSIAAGNLIVRKALPDGTQDWATDTYFTEFSIFNSLENEGTGVAMFSVRLNLGEKTAWQSIQKDGVDCYSIPFSTTLPSGYGYSLQSYYRTKSPGGYEIYSWETIELLNEDVTDLELTDLTWTTPSI